MYVATLYTLYTLYTLNSSSVVGTAIALSQLLPASQYQHHNIVLHLLYSSWAQQRKEPAAGPFWLLAVAL